MKLTRNNHTTYRGENRVILSSEVMGSSGKRRGRGAGEAEIGRAGSLDERGMDGSELHRLGHGSMDVLPANLVVHQLMRRGHEQQ